MKQNALKLVLWAAAFVLLGWLYRQSAQVDIDLHVRTVGHLEQLRQQDARLNQYVLQARYQLLHNYDPLVATRQSITQLLGQLKLDKPEYFSAGEAPLQQAFGRYEALFATKFTTLEDFKSHNSVLRNSMRYFPLAVQQLMALSENSSRRDVLLHDLLESVLLFDINPGAELSQHIEQVMADLQRMELKQRDAIDSLARHVNIILGYQVEVTAFTKSLTQSETANAGDRLFALYGESFVLRQHEADNYKLALALLAAAMLVYVAWVLASLQQARKTLTESLRELEFQKYALDQHSIVSITDRAGKILYTNDKFSEVSQYSRDELLGHDHRLLNSGHHSSEFFKSMWATIGHGKVWQDEVKNRRKDGTFYWVDSTIVPFLDDKGKVLRYVSIRTDITERRAAEKAMQEAKEAAERALKIKSDFLANMSHEIRTPMNGIIGMTNLALDTQLSDEQREYVGLVKSSADSLLHIINDILDFSKIESGKMHIEEIEFSLESTLRDTMKSLAFRAHQKELELLLQVAPDVPDRVRGDPGRLRQVIINLVGNAIKFTESGEIKVLVEREEGAADGRVRLRFAVSDTGIGIPADKFEAIFDSFSQADTSTTRRYGGTGLGLTISAQLVTLMGGHIQLESTLGHGSNFFFSLDMPVQAQGALATYQNTGLVKGMPVLVVDDNETNRRLMAQMLRNWQMLPTVVASGDLALAELERVRHAGQAYPVALLDVQMPGMNGFELASQMMRHSSPPASIMMLTSQGQRGDAQRCRDLGLAAYLTKPVAQSDLLDAIMTALGVPIQQASELVTRHTLREGRIGLKLLLAEDNMVNQKLATVLLGKQGHQVHIANNGLEAIDAWKSQSFDAILMDVDMPEMNGYVATEHIRAAERSTGAHIPIVAMTAHAMQGAREECLSHGMDGYLSKPIQVELLLLELEAFLPRLQSAGQVEVTGSAPDEACVANFAQLRQTVDHNRALFEDLYSQYLADAPQQRERLQQALKQGDLAAMHRAAHAIKGMVGIFAAERTVRAAVQVEQCAALEDAAGAVDVLERSLDELDVVLAAFQW